jgi:hypothetical protein
LQLRADNVPVPRTSSGSLPSSTQITNTVLYEVTGAPQNIQLYNYGSAFNIASGLDSDPSTFVSSNLVIELLRE